MELVTSVCTGMENVCRIMCVVENYSNNLIKWVGARFAVITVMLLKIQVFGSYATLADKWLSF